jgi:pimeloyl-CoA synthetase
LIAEYIGAESFGHAQHQTTQHRARDTADTAQNRSGKRLDPDQEAGVRVDHAVLHAQQYRRDRCQCSTDDERQGDDVVGVDPQQVGHLDVFGTGAAGAAQA